MGAKSHYIVVDEKKNVIIPSIYLNKCNKIAIFFFFGINIMTKMSLHVIDYVTIIAAYK
jgi:hypothetical protein